MTDCLADRKPPRVEGATFELDGSGAKNSDGWPMADPLDWTSPMAAVAIAARHAGCEAP